MEARPTSFFVTQAIALARRHSTHRFPVTCDRTSGGPHPNPDLAKGRGPEAEVKNLLMTPP